MINSLELRIGNYVYDDFNEVHRVECIKSNTFVKWDEGDPETVIFSKLDDRNSMYTCDEVNPIPLSEKWLIRLGAIKVGIEYKLKASALEITIRINADHVYCEFGNVYLGDRIKYVHELQNLYFAVFQKELELWKFG